MALKYCTKPGCGRSGDSEDFDTMPHCDDGDCSDYEYGPAPVEADPKPKPAPGVQHSENPRITIHVPPSDDARALTALLGAVRDVLDDVLPKGRAASLAHTKLDELGMWAAAALNTPEEFQS